MASATRFRDSLRKIVPPWLSDRTSSGKTVGFRLLWSLVAPLDVAMEILIQGIKASWPGRGTPTALPLIGRSRGVLRGQADTNAEYEARLRRWLDMWREAGGAEELARQIHEYLGNRPKVRVVTRSGKWVTVNADGTVVRHSQAWNWDGTSHPERAGYWSELFVIVYPSQWTNTPVFGSTRICTPGIGIGHSSTRTEADAIKGLIAQLKSAHSRIRALIVTSDASLFDPTTPASLPNGSWGAWGGTGSGSRTASSRNVSTCRYMEF